MDGALEAGGAVFCVGLDVWEAAFVLLGRGGMGELGFWLLVGVGGLVEVGVGVGGVGVDRLLGLMLAGLYL